MASVIKGRRPSDPSRLEIEARKAELQEQRGWHAPPVDHIYELNQLLLQQCDDEEDYRDPRQVEEWLPVPTVPKAEPREMTREDIANVEFINSRDLDSVFDSLIEAAAFQHDLEDCECRWNIADVDTDIMDLSDPTPTLVIHDELSVGADERGVPMGGPREMSEADRCNVDMASLIALNLVPEKLSDRLVLGAIDPETMDLGGESLAERQAATAKPIEFQLKTEAAPPFKSTTAWPAKDVVPFRSKRR